MAGQPINNRTATAKRRIIGTPNPAWIALGADLKRERVSRKLSLGQAGTKLRLREQWIDRMEKGIADPQPLAERWTAYKAKEQP